MSETTSSSVKRNALGKGIGALLGGVDESTSSRAEDRQLNVLQVDPNLIDPNPQQPRKIFNEQDIEELADSVRVNGVIQPLVVCKSQLPNRYVLIAGERRLRASIVARLPKVPVVLREGSSEEMLRIALIENIQRSDLNVIEEASAYENLINKYGLTQEQCAQKVGKERSSISNALRLLTLPSQIKSDLIQGRLSFGHGKVLLGLESEDLILKAREVIHKKSLSVRQTEKICKLIKSGPNHQKSPTEDPDLQYLADNLREHLRTKVRLQGSGNRGKIEISYFSASELERVLDMIGPS